MNYIVEFDWLVTFAIFIGLLTARLQASGILKVLQIL